MKFIKKYWHAILFVLCLLACLVLGFGGLIWTDLAKHAFWWNSWVVISILGFVGFIALIFWFGSSRKQW